MIIDDFNRINDVISNISIVSRFIIIKDHFYKSKFSKVILIIMDFIGNFYNNVKIPKNYFTISDYDDFLSKNNINEIKRLTNYYYYKKFWLFFANPNLHFISIIKNEK